MQTKFQKPLKSKFSSEAAETNLDEQFVTSDANTETNELDSYPQTLNEARKRNRKIIEVCCKIRHIHPSRKFLWLILFVWFFFCQDLEKAKARLRMRVMFSPLDEIHEKAQNNYFAAIQTPLKKKYGPIFVWEVLQLRQ